jgi:hypothetical protein
MTNISKDVNTLRVEISFVIGYTIFNLKCTITLVILNLHHFKRDSYYCLINVRPHLNYQGKTARKIAVAHLAFARSQNTGGGISGI